MRLPPLSSLVRAAAAARRYLRALRGLGQPAAIGLPPELFPLYARIVGRGLLSLAAQVDLDWVWPYWLVRQLDPDDAGYLPRAMSPLLLNLGYRTWTGIGPVAGTEEAIVDPRGLVTPRPGGWSLDTWVWTGERLWAPSRLRAGAYEQSDDPSMPLVTGSFTAGGLAVRSRTWATSSAGGAVVVETEVENRGPARAGGLLVFSLRPYDPEGLSPVFDAAVAADGSLAIEGRAALAFSRPPSRSAVCAHRDGDVALALPELGAPRQTACAAGLCTAAAAFPLALAPGERTTVVATTPLGQSAPSAGELARVARDAAAIRRGERRSWELALAEGARFEVPEARLAAALAAARKSLLLLDDGDRICPGPATYHQEWLRDSAYLVTALDRLGLAARAQAKLAAYPRRQRRDGFFLSQEGEWDSVGQALWTLCEHVRLGRDQAFAARLLPPVAKAVRWLAGVLRRAARHDGPARGLLPAGWSAEHLGPIDCYYWDDLWALAGLESAGWLAGQCGEQPLAAEAMRTAVRLRAALERALAADEVRLGRPAMPPAPGRRLDGGMIGGIAALWPLRLLPPHDPRVTDSLAVLHERYFRDGAFLHPVVHSGFNVYLSLQVAHCHLLRGETAETWRIVQACLDLASPTLTWPEAVHPRTRAGCMGDGHHGWAAAELALLVRDALLVEDGATLVLTPAAPAAWAAPGAVAGATGAPTAFGPVSFRTEALAGGRLELTLEPPGAVPPRGLRWRLPAPASGWSPTARRSAPPRPKSSCRRTRATRWRSWRPRTDRPLRPGGLHRHAAPDRARLHAQAAPGAAVLVDHGQAVLAHRDGLVTAVPTRDVADVAPGAQLVVHRRHHAGSPVELHDLGELLVGAAHEVARALEALLLHPGAQALAQILHDAHPLEHDRAAHLEGGGAQQTELGHVLPGADPADPGDRQPDPAGQLGDDAQGDRLERGPREPARRASPGDHGQRHEGVQVDPRDGSHRVGGGEPVGAGVARRLRRSRRHR